MLKKAWRTIETPENGKIEIYGNNREIEIFYSKPEWGKEEEVCFKYKGNIYYLSEFMRIDKNALEWMQEFSGYTGDSYFSGVIIKLSEDGETVKAYTYIC